MSTTPTHCPTCGAELPARGFYCPSCSAQARCKACRELLEPGARACVECGTPVGERTAAGADGRQRETVAPNRIRLEETRTSRSLDVSVTDAAVEYLSEPLSAFLAGGLREAQSSRRRQDRRIGGQITEQMALPTGEDAFEVKGEVVVPPFRQASTPAAPPGDRDRLRRLFKHEGERLVLIDSRLKADTKIEFVTRLTGLFLYAHKLEGRTEVSRAALKDLLDANDVWGADTRKWLSSTRDLLPPNGEMLALSVPGEERAVESLDRIDNPDVAQGKFVPGASAKARATKTESGSGADDEGGVKAKKQPVALASKKIEPWVARWKATGISLGVHNILRGKSVAEKGLFGLWAIRQALGDDGKVVTRVQLAQFLYQAFEIKVDDSTLGRALKNPAMKELVMPVGGTKFQIRPDGTEAVEKMVSQAAGSIRPSPAAVNGASPAST